MQRTLLQRSDRSAACSKVVFPVPASPISRVSALAESQPVFECAQGLTMVGRHEEVPRVCGELERTLEKAVEVEIHRRAMPAGSTSQQTRPIRSTLPLR